METLPSVEPDRKGPIRYIGLDVDGTIENNVPERFSASFGQQLQLHFAVDYESAYAYAQSTIGTPTTKQIIDYFILNGQELVHPRPFDFLQAFAESIDMAFFEQPITLLDGLVEELVKLKQKGYGIFLSSSRPTTNLQRILELHPNLNTVIDFAIGTNRRDESLQKGTSHFTKAAEFYGQDVAQFISQTLYVGDTLSDMFSAIKAGAKAIGREGTYSKTQLLQSGATATFTHFSELSEILDLFNQ